MKPGVLWRKLDKTVLLLAALVLAAAAGTMATGGWDLTLDGLKQTGRLFETVWLRLLLGFTLGGLVRLIIPHAVIARWLGHTSGVRGLIVGAYLGTLLPGGPFVFLPVVASILAAGAGPGPVIALLVGRALLGLNSLVVWQIPFLGARLPLTMFAITLLLPPIIGLVGVVVFRLAGRFAPTATEIAEKADGTDKGAGAD